jgi:hypothetical protein
VEYTTLVVTATIHDRVPVILDQDSYDLWLDPGMKDVNAASDLLKPYDARLMRRYPISTRINHVANDDEGCSAQLAQSQNRLFSSSGRKNVEGSTLISSLLHPRRGIRSGNFYGF